MGHNSSMGLKLRVYGIRKEVNFKKEPSDKPIFCKCKSYCAFANVKVANVQDNRLRSKNATFLLLLTYFFFVTKQVMSVENL